jgi:Flp pilus assembly CpaF family ATPase
MNMLGWRMLKHGDYLLDLPTLSSDEEKLIIEVQEKFKDAVGKGGNDAERLIAEGISKAAKEQGLLLDLDQEDYLSRVAHMHAYGFAFFEQLMKDDEIEEISVIGPNRPIYVFIMKKGWKIVNAVIETEEAVADLINRMSRFSGRHITLQNPRIDAVMPDGSRLHGSLPPVSPGEITIRKFRERPFSPKELAENGTVPADVLAFLSVVMQCDSSVLVAGNTASGKTTTLNGIFSFVPDNERVIITEETPEINVPHKHQLRMVANRNMGIGLCDLVYDSLRMRPDRMIVGEVRNKEEVDALFDVLLAGQARGSYATFHAGSIDEAMSRLRSFGVREMDLGTIDCIVVQRRLLVYDRKKRMAREMRRVVEIGEPKGNRIYKNTKFDCKGDLFDRIAGSFNVSNKELNEEIRMRKKLIMDAPGEFDAFYKKIQGRIFGGTG